MTLPPGVRQGIVGATYPMGRGRWRSEPFKVGRAAKQGGQDAPRPSESGVGPQLDLIERLLRIGDGAVAGGEAARFARQAGRSADRPRSAAWTGHDRRCGRRSRLAMASRLRIAS